MNNINNITISGRTTRDIELKYTQSGMAISTITIASNYSQKVNNAWVEKANFIDIKVFGKTAEYLEKYVKKGNLLLVSGQIRQETWEKDGNKNSKIVVIADKVEFFNTSKSDNTGNTKQEAVENIPDPWGSAEDCPF